MAFGEQLNEFAHNTHRITVKFSVAGIGEEYQQRYDAFWHLKKAADESAIWLNQIAEYLEPFTKNQHLSADDLPG
jgi:hypothetical protein